ncbi:hypothetical protein ACQ4PT_058062 [Festuca glaucescens]
MTVGKAFGDRKGDLANPPPAKVQRGRDDCRSPERHLGGRFWVLQSSDDEEDSDVEEMSSAGGSVSMKYLCQTPTLVSGIDISEQPSELARRKLKRINRQRNQRMAAMAAMELASSEGTWSPSSMPLGMSVCKTKAKAMPVLEPSVFVDDENFRTNGQTQPARSGIDADLLQQTVQAVVAAVTAAQRTTERVGGTVVPAAVGKDVVSGVPNKNVVVSAVAPTTIKQQVEMTNHTLTDAQEGGSKGKETEGQGPLKKKKEDKTTCFRCKKPGHYIDDCPTPFCVLCESVHHVASACHLLHAPKPTAAIHGYANEALMFFELPCGAFKAKVENPKLAKVIVDGDAMTIPEIIEQLRRIVPYEKFNWEVFHLKDNIFRVKLPSKQEVQRLKNFGTYICQDRESCLSFDLWSSLEEPLYMLPKVWVRVSGLPSDMRSDYLSLWGVGTLFGKTLDVDMAFTRKNKVLRTKIGCLDRNLIPADSDVFIRRGFFKLHFEVETVHESQEVNMVDANNGNDRNDGAHNGEGNNAGGHAMDMDHKGNDTDATSNNNENDASNVKNGIDGMQEQLQHFDAIQIGSMNVQLNNSGSPSFESILSKK